MSNCGCILDKRTFVVRKEAAGIEDKRLTIVDINP
jgi:hypothetical protein